MARVTYRLLKNGSTRTTVRNKIGNTTYRISTGGGKKVRTTIATRSGNCTFCRSR